MSENHRIPELIEGADITCLSVSGHRRTSIELIRLNEETRNLEVSELLFLRVRKSRLNLNTRRWLGCIQSFTMNPIVGEGSFWTYEVSFQAGNWIIEAEDCSLSTFALIREGIQDERNSGVTGSKVSG